MANKNEVIRMANNKYEVKVYEKKGSCDNALFEKMAMRGDIIATKLSEVLGQVVHIVGYASCTITTDDKTFDINYFDTEEFGLISSGSEIFFKSVKDYFEEVDEVRLTEVKTKKGKTFKAVPILDKKTTNKEETTKKEEETTNDELPF